MTADGKADDLEAKLRAALPDLASASARALSAYAVTAMAPAAAREATERQQAQVEGRTVTMADVAAMVRRLAGPVVMLDTCAPTHKLLVMELSEFNDRRRIIMHPDTARTCWRNAPLESTLLGVPDPDAPRG